jgi:3-(methylthio)propanoyl-CoA dehydrogenase
MTTYAAPLRDMLFTMKEVGGLDAVCAQPGFEETTPDVIEAIQAHEALVSLPASSPIPRNRG